MEKRSSLNALHDTYDIAWKLFEKTGKIDYYGAAVSCKELAREYKKQDEMGAQR